jgi:phenylalanyl-tRNA synthetase beta chain
MKASIQWLRELCPALPDDASAIAARFTAAGLEVEGVHAFGLGTEACVVASLVSTRPHPSRSGLRLVTVERGGGQQEVVCGAPNLPDPGGLVVLAPLGTHLPAKAMTVEARAIAGVTSEGMLCSEAELGLGDDSDGILVLPPSSAPPGTALSQAWPAARDTVLEIALTPNRPDGLGHVGLAREAAALFAVPFVLRPAAPDEAQSGRDGSKVTRGEDLAKYVKVTIDDAERCPHYGAAVSLDVTVAPSPLAVRWRLAALGMRSISNIVDVTNLVMLELGHPMHAFDLERVRGATILVRRAVQGEKLVTLDRVERSLTADDLVICDAGAPLALAGVMGGGNSEISPTTSRVLFECAYFDARGVRRTARRHGLHTESSHRFERGVDWGDTSYALARASALTTTLAGGRAVNDARVFEAMPLARRSVSLRRGRVGVLLGDEVANGDAHAILGRLGFSCKSSGPDVDLWEVPSFRPDVSREVDLIEEVARVRGFDAIPTTLPRVRPSRDHGPREALARRARRAGVDLGLSEAITYAFLAAADLEKIGAPPPAVTLRNPLTEDRSAMRTSLLPGLLAALAHARRHGERDVRMFTVGTLFLVSSKSRPRSGEADDAAPEERLGFGAIVAGKRPAWLSKPEAIDIWDGKGLAEGLVARMLRREVDVRIASPAEHPKHLHPRGAAFIEVDGRRVGSLGPLHPDVLQAFDLDEGAIVVEVDLLALDAIGQRSPRFALLPRFPATARDIAIVVSDKVAAGDVEHAVRHAAGGLAESVSLFDRFVGGAVPPGHTSLGLHVLYRAKDRTLTDAEVDERHAQVISEVERRFGAQLR